MRPAVRHRYLGHGHGQLRQQQLGHQQLLAERGAAPGQPERQRQLEQQRHDDPAEHGAEVAEQLMDKAMMVAAAMVAAAGLLAGCDRPSSDTPASSNSSSSGSTSVPPAPPGGSGTGAASGTVSGSGSASGSTTPSGTTASGTGTPSASERVESKQPQQGQVDTKEGEQRKDFEKSTTK